MNNQFLHHCLDVAIEVHPMLEKVKNAGMNTPDTPIEVTHIVDFIREKGFAGEGDFDILEALLDWLAQNLSEGGTFDFARYLYHLFAEGEAKH